MNPPTATANPRFTDPDFRYPSGATRADMEEFHRRWNHEHQTLEPEQLRSTPSILQGEADPTLDDDDSYAARMASEEPTCWCPLCSEPLYLGATP